MLNRDTKGREFALNEGGKPRDTDGNEIEIALINGQDIESFVAEGWAPLVMDMLGTPPGYTHIARTLAPMTAAEDVERMANGG